jgi:hypothetical protein
MPKYSSGHLKTIQHKGNIIVDKPRLPTNKIFYQGNWTYPNHTSPNILQGMPKKTKSEYSINTKNINKFPKTAEEGQTSVTIWKELWLPSPFRKERGSKIYWRWINLFS